jgi:hypothetical protein
VRTPEFGKPEGRTADPSTTLRSGRDDNLSGNAKYSFQDELSSRPERSVVEGSAVRPSGFPKFWSYSAEFSRRLFSPYMKPHRLFGLKAPALSSRGFPADFTLAGAKALIILAGGGTTEVVP